MSDLIDRQAAIDALADYIHNVDKVMGTGHLTADDCKDAAASVLEELPSVQTERKKGKWIDFDDDAVMTDTVQCSVCRKQFTVDADRFYDIGFVIEDLRFCPNCGARMEGIDETD
jgi:ribosomal protein S27AE